MMKKEGRKSEVSMISKTLSFNQNKEDHTMLNVNAFVLYYTEIFALISY